MSQATPFNTALLRDFLYQKIHLLSVYIYRVAQQSPQSSFRALLPVCS
jgi:hypothetical protein